MSRPPFHLAFPIYDLEETRRFYCDVLGCLVWHKGDSWIDFNFYGHHLTAYVKLKDIERPGRNFEHGKPVPVRHFGVVLGRDAWDGLRTRLAEHNIGFYQGPSYIHQGTPDEEGSFYIEDPSGNILEFRGMLDVERLCNG